MDKGKTNLIDGLGNNIVMSLDQWYGYSTSRGEVRVGYIAREVDNGSVDIVIKAIKSNWSGLLEKDPTCQRKRVDPGRLIPIDRMNLNQFKKLNSEQQQEDK